MNLTPDQWIHLSGTHGVPQLTSMTNDRGMSADLFLAEWPERTGVVKVSRNRDRGLRELQALQWIERPDVPSLLGSLVEPDRVVLLLEDLRDATPGDILKGVDIDQAHATATLLGNLHAQHWNAQAPGGWSTAPQRWRDTTTEHIHAFLARNPHSWGEARLPGLQDAVAAHRPVLSSAPNTLAHADAHLDNFMYRDTPILIDWETARMAPGAVDLVRFLMEGVHTDVRRPHHDELIDTWLRELPGVSRADAEPWLQAAAWWSLNAMIPHHATVDLDALPPRMRRVHHHCAQQVMELAADLLG